MTDQQRQLSKVNSFEEYENLRQDHELFKRVALEIIARHHLPNEPLSSYEGTNIVFSYGKDRIIKIFPPLHLSHFNNEVLVMNHLHNRLSVATPAIECKGTISGWPYIVMSQLDGVILEGLWEKLDHRNKLIIIRELGSLIREVHSLPTNGLEAIDCHWKNFITQQISQCVSLHQSLNFPENLLQQIPRYLELIAASLLTISKPVILTGEYTPMNFLVKQDKGIWHISGLIDFGDSMLGKQEYDLLGPGAFLIQGDKTLLKEFLLSYGYLPENMTSSLSHQLTALMLLHRYSNLEIQIRIKNWKSKVNSIDDLENLVWGL